MIKLLKSVNDFWNHLWYKVHNEELPVGDSSLLVANNISTPNESVDIKYIKPINTETIQGENDNNTEGENNESSNDTLPNSCCAFIRQQTYMNSSDTIILGASLRGKSHIESNTDCQDYHLYQELSDGWSILVVSDGAGSAKYAGRGSKANCTISIKLLSEMIAKNKWIENSILPSELDWHIEFRTICERMKQIYQNKVEEMNDGSVLTDFNATLLICVITPNGMLSGHIGDGRMGYYSVNGEWKNLMTPHKGEEGNQTLFLQSNWDKPHVPALKVSNVYVPETRVIRDIPKAVVLISDGCERSCWECSIFDTNIGKYSDVNSPHPGFMDPLIESIIAEEDSNRFNLFVDIIDKGTKACQTERDDKTMLIVMSKINHGIPNI